MTFGTRCAAEAPEGFSISPGRTCGFAAQNCRFWEVLTGEQAQLRAIASGIDPPLVKEVVDELQQEERKIWRSSVASMESRTRPTPWRPSGCSVTMPLTSEPCSEMRCPSSAWCPFRQ
jgi:hypothetical protein